MRHLRQIRYAFLVLLLLATAGCGDFVIKEGESGILTLRGARKAYGILTIEGTVTDESGNPLSGIRIVVDGRYFSTRNATYGKEIWPVDTLRTNSEGIYSALSLHVSPPHPNLLLTATDTAGRFVSDRILIRDIIYSGGDASSFAGTAAIKIPGFTLKKSQR